jgi:glycosyltransferase involved in cell wall biosynthesis
LQKKGGHSVAIVTPHIDYYRPGQINEHYIYDDIDVYQFLETADPKNRQIHYGKKKPEGLNNFSALIYQLKPDVIHFHELNRSIGITIEHVKITRQTGAKVFLTMHLSSYTCSTNILVYNNALCDGMIKDFRCSECCYKTLFKIPSLLANPLTYLSMMADKTGITDKIADSKIKTLLTVPATIRRTRQELQEIVTNVDQLISYSRWYKKILIGNGVPENKLTVLPAALASISKNENYPKKKETVLPVKMVFIGRIQPTKGIHLIIEAMHSFSPGQVQIDIYGRPETTDYYKQCISDSTGMPHVIWKGEINREEVVERLAQYDIFCLASTFSEMSPLVIQEAFAAQIPVLASKVYGNVEQIQDNYNGLLFEFNSSLSLKRKIQNLVEDTELLPHLKRNIIQPNNFESVSNAYLELYVATYKSSKCAK